VTYFASRLRNNEKQLANYREQVERCTIRAPHDGFLIYANEDDDDTRVELGSTVRQRQDLFFLPDLGRMEIRTTLNETMVRRVEPGMTARVRVEALPHALLEGEVVSVAPLPMSKRSWAQSDDIKNFEARVELHAIPEGLMPGMTAEVEIQTAHRQDALVIPPQALTVEDGREVCYVARGGRLERRKVRIGASNPEMIEVLDGVEEGERVVTDLAWLASGRIEVVDLAEAAGSTPSAAHGGSDPVDPEVTAAEFEAVWPTSRSLAATHSPRPTL
jgi:HlyD family secretion protein